jgi:hypothetical protein
MRQQSQAKESGFGAIEHLFKAYSILTRRLLPAFGGLLRPAATSIL